MVVFGPITKCKHRETKDRRFICDGGSVQIREQCIKCGASMGNAKKKYPGWEALDEFDFELQKTVFCELEDAEARINEKRSSQFWPIYNEYLLSDEWERKRQLILKRANGICEGCLEREAKIVHHMTYTHVYNELAYELVALCHECHEFAHAPYDWRKLAFGGDVEL